MAMVDNTVINDHDLRDLNSWLNRQLYSEDIAYAEIIVESKRDPTQVEHNKGEKNKRSNQKLYEHPKSACVKWSGEDVC